MCTCSGEHQICVWCCEAKNHALATDMAHSPLHPSPAGLRHLKKHHRGLLSCTQLLATMLSRCASSGPPTMLSISLCNSCDAVQCVSIHTSQSCPIFTCAVPIVAVFTGRMANTSHLLSGGSFGTTDAAGHADVCWLGVHHSQHSSSCGAPTWVY